MAGYKVKITGIPELTRALENKKNMAKAKDIVRTSTINIAKKSQTLVPVGWGKKYPAKTKAPKGYRGGTLKRSMQFEVSDDGLKGEVSYNANYAAYQEYGTRKLPARHYLKAPFESEKEVFISKMKGLAK